MPHKRQAAMVYRKDIYTSNNLFKGLDHLNDPMLNKGLAFPIEERQALGIHGLLPPAVKTVDVQVEHCLLNFNRYSDELDKYIYLMGLMDQNEKLFFRFMEVYVDLLLPIAYTPVVGLACQNYSAIFRNPKGLYITINDKGHVYEVLKNWPRTDVRAIVVTDGERILGLGDLGAQGMGIPVGKLTLYTALGGIKPTECLPITIDVGTNTKSLLEDKHYIGIRRNRITGQEYDDLIEEFMQAVVQRFGHRTLIQFEDFANTNSFRMLNKYRNYYCTFNDDIQGTGSVVLAGLILACKVRDGRETNLSDNTFLFLGAGSAAIGIAEMIIMLMKEEGCTEEQAAAKIFLSDRVGLVTSSRTDLSEIKRKFAHNVKQTKDFAESVKMLEPHIIIGAAGAGRLFTPEILKDMANFNKRPIVFALSNPTSKAECTAEEAYIHTDGRVLFASGSPFDPVTYKGKTFYPRQANNSYIFPGVVLGVISVEIRTISEHIFIAAAKALAKIATKEDTDLGSLYPPLQKTKHISLEIATEIATFAYKEGTAGVFPEPKNKRAFISVQRYNNEYVPSVQVYPFEN